ncbi:MAG: preprotein translocase subunit SecB [Clostridium sp.]|nr:preprotein translocase subunit SecB [Clostridium sp.]
MKYEKYVANRISQFSLETKDIDTKAAKAKVVFDFDYNILQLEKEEERHIGCIEFASSIKAKVRNSILFKVELKMEGIFVGNPQKLNIEQFKEMLELNGVATLSQLCRAYILSISALSGISPAIKLPMINVLSLRKKKNKMSEQ